MAHRRSRRASWVAWFAVCALTVAGCNCYQAPIECQRVDCLDELDAGLSDAGFGGADASVTDAGVTDAGEADAGVLDAGESDAGQPDAGAPDAGVPDAGAPDAGEPDAGESDAGQPDAGQPDAGETDAGETDAGETDAGETDAGATDAGETDAGEIDAGEIDAGEPDAGAPDAGLVDAGIPWPLGVWDVVFVCTINCTGTYPHTMTITQFDPSTGAFSGFGVYNVDSRYTWTVTGSITPPSVAFTLIYTGFNAGYRAQQTGFVMANGSMAGTGTTTQNQTHDWAATRRP